MSVLLALIGLPLALLFPGWTTLAALARQQRLALPERIYLGLSISLVVSGWLGLLLAQLRIFSAGLLLALLALYSLTLSWVAWRRGRWRRPKMDTFRGAAPELLAFLAITVLFVALTFRPFELILGPRDAAVYPATGAQIAHHGSILIDDPLVAGLLDAPEEEQEALRRHFFLYQHPERLYYEDARMPGFFIADLEEGTVVPQFYNLYPTWLAIAFSLLGLKAGLLMTPYLALLGGMGLYMIARRLFGRPVALAAYLLLTLTTLQVWFARYSTSEAATQFLTLLAIYALLRLEEREDGGPADFWGLLAGVALGMIGLVRVDFFFTWALLLPYLAYLFVTRRFRRPQRLLLLGLGLLALHTLVQLVSLTWAYTLNSYYHRIQDLYTLSWLVWPFLPPVMRHYFLGRTPIMHQPWRLSYELGGPLLLGGLLVGLRRAPRLGKRMGLWLEKHRRPLLGLAAGLFLLVAAYAYLVRPGLLSPEVLRHPLENRLILEGYVGAPVPEGRAANLVRLGWYLSPLGIVLGVVGIGGLIFWESSRRSWFLLLVGLFYTAFFTYEVFGVPHHIYIMRRYVPVVLPFFCIGIAYALGRLAHLPVLRRAGRLLAVGLGLLTVFYLGWTGRPFFQHTEYRGALDQVEALAKGFSPDDVVLLVNYGRDVPFALATPLHYLFDRPALVVIHMKPDGALIEAQIQRWQAQGRQVHLLVGNGGGRLFLPHTRLRWIDRFELAVPEFEQLTAQKPHNSYILHLPFGLYEPEPWDGQGSPIGELPLTVDLGAGGYKYQVSGFHQDEIASDGTTFCWTNGQGVLRLPWPEGSATVTVSLRLAGGKRPAELGPAQVSLCFGEECLEAWSLEEGLSVYHLALPADSVPLEEGRTVLLSLRGPAWRQVDHGLGGDLRPLGVQVDWVRVESVGGGMEMTVKDLLKAPLRPNKEAAGVKVGAKTEAVKALWGEPVESEQAGSTLVRWSYGEVWFWIKNGRVDQIAVYAGKE